MRWYCLVVGFLVFVVVGSASVRAGVYYDEVIADEPIAYWRLGETEGPEAANIGLLGQEDIGHGTYSTGALLGQSSLVLGETDTSSYFTGGKRVTTEGFEKFDDVAGFGGTGFSVEFWTCFNTIPTSFVNLVGDGQAGMDFTMMVYAGTGGIIRPHVQTDFGFSSIDSVRQLEVGEVVHVVSTWDYDEGALLLYLDGELAEFTVSAGSDYTFGELINRDNPVYIGQDGREPSPSAWFDEVALYNYPLDPTRVAAHYNAGKGAPTPELPEPPEPFPDPGNIPGLPTGLVTYIDFDEAAGPGVGGSLDYAYDRQDDNDGSFQGNAARVAGLVGVGAASFDNLSGSQVALGTGTDDNFSVTGGITVEALIKPEWTGESLDYDEIFRKDDGDQRILFSFQNDSNNGGANPPVDEGPVLSLGLNTGGYQELDMPLDVDLTDLDGGNADSGTVWLRLPPDVELGPNDLVLADGGTHHAVATYDQDTGEKAIWIDGVKRWSVEVDGNPEVFSGGAAVAYIGSWNGGENFNGVIDEFAFWERALSAQEIAEHFANVQAGMNYFGIGGVPGDFDGDGLLTTADIDLLTAASAVNSDDRKFDLNGDNLVNEADVSLWIKGEDYAFSWIGDANVDGEFNTADFVGVLTAGKYELNVDAVWSEGDWNGDGQFNAADLVLALQDGGYEFGPRDAVAAAAVPEPHSIVCMLLGVLLLSLKSRRRVAA